MSYKSSETADYKKRSDYSLRENVKKQMGLNELTPRNIKEIETFVKKNSIGLCRRINVYMGAGCLLKSLHKFLSQSI